MFLEKSKNARKMMARNGILEILFCQSVCFCIFSYSSICTCMLKFSRQFIPLSFLYLSLLFLYLLHLLLSQGRSKTYSGRHRHSSARLSYAGHVSHSPVLIKKANSCSTIYIDDSTVTLPNLKSTLKWCVYMYMYI